MLEIHLRKPEFTYSTSEKFTKNKERTQTFKETGDWIYIYQKKLDNACFQHDTAYRGFKYLTSRTFSDKILHDKVFNIAINPECDGYQRGLASMVYNIFNKKFALLAKKSASGGTVKKKITSNKELAEELHKLINRKFKKRKVQSLFIDNIWCAHLADMQLLISKFNKGFHFMLLLKDIL